MVKRLDIPGRVPTLGERNAWRCEKRDIDEPCQHICGVHPFANDFQRLRPELGRSGAIVYLTNQLVVSVQSLPLCLHSEG